VRFPVPAAFEVLFVQLPEACELVVVLLLADVVVWKPLVVDAGVELDPVDVLVSGCHGLVGTAIVII